MWSSCLSPDNYRVSLSLEVKDSGAQGPAQVRPPPLAHLYSCNLPFFKFHQKLPPFQLSFPNWRSRLCHNQSAIEGQNSDPGLDRAGTTWIEQKKKDGCSRLGWQHNSTHWVNLCALWASLYLFIKWGAPGVTLLFFLYI